jgi:RNA polymerase sigma factor (sigma-70 family)
MADEPDDKDKPVFQQSTPLFLRLLDEDPPKAMALFYDFTWKLFLSHPPAIFLPFSLTEREDLIERVIEKCCRDGFRNLRKYEDRGRPFAIWLYKVARNEAVSEIRSLEAEKRRRRLMVAPEIVRPDLNFRKSEALSALRQCFDLLSEKQQEILRRTVTGEKPRHIAEVMGLGAGGGKIVSEQLRQARKLLKKALKKKGIDLSLLEPWR